MKRLMMNETLLEVQWAEFLGDWNWVLIIVYNVHYIMYAQLMLVKWLKDMCSEKT